MFCKTCGTSMADDAKFCPNCGTPAPAPETASYTPSSDYTPSGYTPENSYTPQTQYNTPLYNTADVPSTPALIFGILSLAMMNTFFLAFLGIIFGAIALSKANACQAITGELTGKAKVGRILGKIGLITSIVVTAIFVVYFFLFVIIFSML